MNIKITRQSIRLAKKENHWNLGNSVLYQLCKKYPSHKKANEVIAKVWLIGRAYAAAIERRKKNRKLINDDFYKEVVAPKIIEAKMDKVLRPLFKLKKINKGNANQILHAHYHLQKLFKSISKLEKRSLASKYLHFHFPNLFFIYDSRANDALNKTGIKLLKSEHNNNGDPISDKTYRTFVMKCLKLQDLIKLEHKIWLNPRELDTILIEGANSKSRSKRKKKAPTN